MTAPVLCLKLKKPFRPSGKNGSLLVRFSLRRHYPYQVQGVSFRTLSLAFSAKLPRIYSAPAAGILQTDWPLRSTLSTKQTNHQPRKRLGIQYQPPMNDIVRAG